MLSFHFLKPDSYTFIADPSSQRMVTTIYVWIFFLLILMPLVNFSELPNSTQSSKFLFFQYALLVFVLIFLVYIFTNKKTIHLNFTIIDCCAGILLTYIVINRYLIQYNYSFSFPYYELISLSIFYVIIRNCKASFYPFLLIAVILSGVVESVYGNLQLYGLLNSNNFHFNLTGSFFNPGPFAGFISISLTLAVGLYLFRDNLLNKINFGRFQILVIIYVPVIALLFILIILPATQSRAAWLAGIFGVLFLVFVRFKLKEFIRIYFFNQTAKKVCFIFFSLLILAISAQGLYKLKQESVDGRIVVWKVITQMAADRPFFGYGFDSFKAFYMNYQAAYFRNDINTSEVMLADNVTYAFNEPLQFLVENGILGFALGIFSLVTLFLVPNSADNIIVICKAAIVAILVFSMFSYPSQILQIKIVLVLCIGIIAVNARRFISFEFNPQNSSTGKIKNILLVCLFAGTAFAFHKIYTIHQGMVAWQQALIYNNNRNYDKAIPFFHKAFLVFNTEGEYLVTFGKTLSLNAQHKKALEILLLAKSSINNTILQTTLGDSYKALGNYLEAEEAYLEAYYMVPSRFYPKYLLAKLYDQTSQPGKAKEVALEILSKEVKVESVAIEEIRNEVKKILEENAF